MKTNSIIILLAVILIALCGCKKIEFRNDISGQWNINRISGGFILQTPTPYFDNLYLKKNNHYFIYRNDTLLASGSYNIDKAMNGIFFGAKYEILFRKDYDIEKRLFFPFDESVAVTYYSSDTLYLHDYMSDGFGYLFTRPK